MVDDGRFDYGAKEHRLIAPKQDHFSWVTAWGFVVQELNSDGASVCLTEEQRSHLKALADVVNGNDIESVVLRRLLWRLNELSLLIQIDGFRGENRMPVNLVEWATRKTACLPVPFEDLVFSYDETEALTELAKLDELTMENNRTLDETDEFAKKYVRGLLFEDDSGELRLFNSSSALDMAYYGFYVFTDGVACAYWALHKQTHNANEIWRAYDETCQAIGALQSWQEPQEVKKNSKRYLNYARKKVFFDEWAKKWSTMEREDFLYKCCKDGQKQGVSASRPTIYREMRERGLT